MFGNFLIHWVVLRLLSRPITQTSVWENFWKKLWLSFEPWSKTKSKTMLSKNLQLCEILQYSFKASSKSNQISLVGCGAERVTSHFASKQCLAPTTNPTQPRWHFHSSSLQHPRWPGVHSASVWRHGPLHHRRVFSLLSLSIVTFIVSLSPLCLSVIQI